MAKINYSNWFRTDNAKWTEAYFENNKDKRFKIKGYSMLKVTKKMRALEEHNIALELQFLDEQRTVVGEHETEIERMRSESNLSEE